MCRSLSRSPLTSALLQKQISALPFSASTIASSTAAEAFKRRTRLIAQLSIYARLFANADSNGDKVLSTQEIAVLASALDGGDGDYEEVFDALISAASSVGGGFLTNKEALKVLEKMDTADYAPIGMSRIDA